MREETIKLYQFDELSDKAKEKVIEKFHNINIDYDWWEFVYEDAKEIGKLMGIDIDNIYFSGFWSQGDGACFTGSYEYRKNSVKLVKEYAPKDIELHRIVKELQIIQKKCFYKLCATIKQSGHYSHKYSTSFDVQHCEGYLYSLPENAEEEIIKTLRDFMDWIYCTLEKEYEYQTSEEAIIETIRCNEYEFTEDGELY